MTHQRDLFTLILAVSLCLFSSCRTNNTPATPPDPNYLYLTVRQNAPSCPLTLTVKGPTNFQDVLGSSSLIDSLIAFNYGAGNYTFTFNGVTDGVSHGLSGPETISCSPLSTASCSGWSYTVQP